MATARRQVKRKQPEEKPDKNVFEFTEEGEKKELSGSEDEARAADISKVMQAKKKRLESLTKNYMKGSQQKLEQLWNNYHSQRQQLKILQQARMVQNQKLKTVRELYELFVKTNTLTPSPLCLVQNMEDMEKSHDAFLQGAQQELRKEMATLQKKILMDTVSHVTDSQLLEAIGQTAVTVATEPLPVSYVTVVTVVSLQRCHGCALTKPFVFVFVFTLFDVAVTMGRIVTKLIKDVVGGSPGPELSVGDEQKSKRRRLVAARGEQSDGFIPASSLRRRRSQTASASPSPPPAPPVSDSLSFLTAEERRWLNNEHGSTSTAPEEIVISDDDEAATGSRIQSTGSDVISVPLQYLSFVESSLPHFLAAAASPLTGFEDEFTTVYGHNKRHTWEPHMQTPPVKGSGLNSYYYYSNFRFYELVCRKKLKLSEK
ncbi:Synaptonemal complex protein 3 [Collichthys lucidus]|uniref:Synaptonemal complex protein 3 n=1 Tax=Collichthys lucidus TaxID=240159 RepID=A0A4U5UEG9_COLLU|nr:Synaptonemal complex protein 3 [Collichthys lucidus]